MSRYDGHELLALKEANNYYAWIFQEYKPVVWGRVLEIGAGIGTFSEYLLRLSIKELTCIEPSLNLIPFLKQRFASVSVRVFPQTLKEYAANNFEPFNTIVCVNVLEHIEDDHQALKIMNSLLKIGGNLCLLVPAIPWIYGTLDKSFGHYRRYAKSRLVALLAESGFGVCRLRFLHAIGILTWILMGKILRWNTWDPRLVKAYDRFATPIIRRVEDCISPPIGQSLLLIGTKVSRISM